MVLGHGDLLLDDEHLTKKRMIINRRRITRKDGILPPRFRTLKKQGKAIDLDVPALFPMHSDYYELRG
jgi:hypothetical protein